MKDLIKKLEDSLEQAKKLTTKERKAMKESTFCGPNRSFPVNDCKHAASAKTYLNRSNFSKSVKQQIAACINRKAKALGCPEGKPAKVTSSMEEIEKFMDDPVWDSTKELIAFFEEAAKDKAVVCSECDNQCSQGDNYCSNCGEKLEENEEE